VGHELGAEVDLDSGHGGQEPADLRGAGGVAGAESVDVESGVGLKHLLTLQLLEVSDGQLEDVGLLQLGDGLAFGLESGDHQVLEVVQALVDPGSSSPLEERLHHFPVLVGARHGGLVDQVVVVELDGRLHVGLSGGETCSKNLQLVKASC